MNNKCLALVTFRCSILCSSVQSHLETRFFVVMLFSINLKNVKLGSVVDGDVVAELLSLHLASVGLDLELELGSR